MYSPFLLRSRNRLSSALRPRLSPPSRALSTRTSNQVSMLLPKNCTETPYTSTPGSTAIKANIRSSLNVSLEPNTRALSLRRRFHSW